MEQHPAAAFSLPELVHVWNLGYAGYFVPLRFTDAMLRTHLRCGGIDLSRSRVWTERGEPAAISLLGVRGGRAWIGGFAVAPAFRGRGLSYPLFAGHVAEIRGWGFERVQLEVLTANWARKAYERAGLSVTRTLQVLRGTLAPGPSAGPARVCSVEDALAALAEHQGTFAPAWTREAAWVRGMVAGDSGVSGDSPDPAATADAGAFVVDGDGGPAGALAWMVQGGAIRVLDAAAADEAAGTALLAALAARHPGRTAMVTNEPDGSPMLRALQAAAFEQPHAQYEMHLAF